MEETWLCYGLVLLVMVVMLVVMLEVVRDHFQGKLVRDLKERRGEILESRVGIFEKSEHLDTERWIQCK